MAFIDLSKAYDKVDRDLLIARMFELCIDPLTIIRTAKWLSISSISSGDKNIKSKIGAPQGSCASPSLFTIAINPIVEILEKSCEGVLLYADDIVLIYKGKAQLSQTLQKLEKQCIGNEMLINKKKSGIMKLRLMWEKRNVETHFNGFPFVDRYKYPGIVL